MATPAGPDREKAFELFSQGQVVTEVARHLRKSRSTVWSWYESWCSGQETPQKSQNDLSSVRDLDLQKKEMEISALKQRLKIAEGTRPEVQVVAAYEPLPTSTPEARWKAAEVDNAEHIRKALLMAQFSVELPDEPCAITFVSDQHISIGNTVDLQRMREDAQKIAEVDGCYAILGGDATDNHIKHRSAVLAARSQPSDQFELFEWYLSIFAHRVLVAISGNHDLWTNQMAGVDVLSGLLKQQRVCYAPDEALMTVKLGSQTYRIGVRHQYRLNSSFNETHAVKQWFRNGEHNWDIGCICHNHSGCIEPFMGHGIERWACRPGSYQIASAYSRQFGYNTTYPTCPTFVIWPDRRKIVGFHQLEDGLLYLRAARNA